MSEGGSDNTAVKIIAIIGGVVVVIVVSCGVLGYFGIRAMREMASGFEQTIKQFAEDSQQSQKVVESFLADIRADKLWIQEDQTEAGLASELVEMGVPKEAIVLAFHAPYKRPYTGFAVV